MTSDDDIAAHVSKLKGESGRDIHLSGGARLAQTMSRLDLVDEYRFFVHPVISRGAAWFEQIALPGWGEPFSFDAETAVDVVVEQFLITEVLRWDTAAVRLPDAAAVRLFLRGRGLSEGAAADEAARRRCPLRVTKRGCLIWARKAGNGSGEPVAAA